MCVPEYLYHYYDASHGPFRSLSDLPPEQARAVQASLRSREDYFASRRPDDYLEIRRVLEKRVRQAFIAKGGRPVRRIPHYMTLGPCDWLLSWYPLGGYIRIPLARFDPHAVSFTYGDTFPAMRYADGMPTRGQVYTQAELEDLIQTFGLPQFVNPNGRRGPDRYIEAQVWDDQSLASFIKETGIGRPFGNDRTGWSPGK